MQAALMLRQLTNQPVSAHQQAEEPQQSDTIRNLEERLQFANETINALLSSGPQAEAELEEPGETLERQRQEWLQELQATKEKAHEMLLLKDEEIKRLQQATKSDSPSEESKEPETIGLEYVRNIVFKYLELRYGRKKDKAQVRTIEQVLMSELAFSFEQTAKIDGLIQKKKQASWAGLAAKVISR